MHAGGCATSTATLSLVPRTWTPDDDMTIIAAAYALLVNG
jgi:hypothetical protein